MRYLVGFLPLRVFVLIVIFTLTNAEQREKFSIYPRNLHQFLRDTPTILTNILIKIRTNTIGNKPVGHFTLSTNCNGTKKKCRKEVAGKLVVGIFFVEK